MTMSERHKVLLYLKGFIASSISKCNHSLRNNPSQLPFSLQYSTTTSGNHSFAVSYLVNNFGFSPESASKWSKDVCFKTSERPDSVLSFFRNHGFAESQIQDVVTKAPWLLSCDPDKSVLPKFQFLLSKGASTSDIVHMVTTFPKFLRCSLENHIIPAYRLINGFLQSDDATTALIKGYPYLLGHSRVDNNVKLLLDSEVTDSNVARLIRCWPKVICSYDLRKVVEEVKQLRFDPSKSGFTLALVVKTCVVKSLWDAKVEAYKRWGWPDQAISEAFRKEPLCMLASEDKIKAVMSFWVNQLGWDSLNIVIAPRIVNYSLEKRIIPRASVLQFLLSKGLMKKDASLTTPFLVPEKLFLQKFVHYFQEESTLLLELYEGKMNIQRNRESSGMYKS